MMKLVQLSLAGYFLSKTTTLYHPLIFAAILIVGAVQFILSERSRADNWRDASFFLWAVPLWFVLTIIHATVLALGEAPTTVAYWWFVANLLAVFYLAARSTDLSVETTRKVVWFLLGYVGLGVLVTPLVLARSLPDPLRFGYTFLGSLVVGIVIVIIWFRHAPRKRRKPDRGATNHRGKAE